MTKIEQVTVDGRDFKVVMPDFEQLRMDLEVLRKAVKSGDEPYQILWEDADSEDVDVYRDLSNIRLILDQVEENADHLISTMMEIRKKKNGGFWKNSGMDVYIARYTTRYFTDFTNAWSVLVLRLDVIDEDTCEFGLRYRTFS